MGIPPQMDTINEVGEILIERSLVHHLYINHIGMSLEGFID